MIFTPTRLEGIFIVDLRRLEDERGFFARSWCADEFAEHGLNSKLAQCSISFNAKKGTLRGMHYQADPYPEDKLVRCTAGAVYDVALDLRPDSSTFKQWLAVELTAENGRAIYIPVGCAHGFQTLTDNAEVSYQMSEYFHPTSARGVRWDDSAFFIEWPDDERIMSDRDAQYPDFVL